MNQNETISPFQKKKNNSAELPYFIKEPKENLFIASSEATNVFYTNIDELKNKDLDLLFNKTSNSFEQFKKRLNDYDTNIMEQNAKNSIKDQSLKIELQIQETERELEKIQEHIDLIKTLKIDYDKTKLDILIENKKILDNKLNEQKEIYKKLGLTYNIADVLSETLTKTEKKFNFNNIITNNPVYKFIQEAVPALKNKIMLKNEIGSFVLLNKKLKEFASNKAVPFGESESNLKHFTYLFDKANQIDAKIKKMLDEESNQDSLKNVLFSSAKIIFNKH